MHFPNVPKFSSLISGIFQNVDNLILGLIIFVVSLAVSRWEKGSFYVALFILYFGLIIIGFELFSSFNKFPFFNAIYFVAISLGINFLMKGKDIFFESAKENAFHSIFKNRWGKIFLVLLVIYLFRYLVIIKTP